MTCMYCEEECELDRHGQPLHLECRIRMVAGSSAHQLMDCKCYMDDSGEAGTREDPPGWTKRQGAILAAEVFAVLKQCADDDAREEAEAA